MNLTIEEAATRLGKSARQVRYLIKNERLKARKRAGRWFIDSADLTLSTDQRQAVERKERQLRAAVEDGLGLNTESRSRPRYSVRDLKAFQIGMPVLQDAAATLGKEHPATKALKHLINHLSRGCHRFQAADKSACYQEARDSASLAVSELLLEGGEVAEQMVTTIEQELMAALAGLLRRLERKRSR